MFVTFALLSMYTLLILRSKLFNDITAVQVINLDKINKCYVKDNRYIYKLEIVLELSLKYLHHVFR